MPNRQLTDSELEQANELLRYIRTRLDELSAGNWELRFAYNRKVAKELTYDERGTPMHRRIVKRTKWREQNGKCAECGSEMSLRYSVLDRITAMDGYTKENTRLIHAECDIKIQAARGYRAGM